MKQNYKCLKCNRTFSAEPEDAFCPSCGSDNVTPVTSDKVRIIYRILLIVAIVCFLFFVSVCLLKSCKEADGQQPAPQPTPAPQQPLDTVPVTVDTIPVSQRVEVKGKDSIVSHIAEVRTQIVVKDADGKTVEIIQDNVDTRVIRIDTIRIEEKTIEVEKPVIPYDERMTLPELTQYFKDKDRTLESHDAISNFVKIRVRGLRNDDHQPRQTLKNVFDNLLSGHWKSATPSQCTHNSNTNLIGDITLEIKYPD